MKRIILALTLALALGACTTIQALQGFSVTQGELDAAQNTYDGTVLTPLHKYSALRRCLTGETFTISSPCHDRALLKRIRAGDKVASQSFADTQSAITSGDNKGAVAAYNTMKTAVGTVQALIALSGAASL